MALPAGVKDVKLNLTHAYRTTFTHIQTGDAVRVEARRDGWAVIPSATYAPKRSYWAGVVGVEKVGRQVRITLATGAVMTDFPHTAITRDERAEECRARLDADAQAREDSLRAIEEGRIQKALADHPTDPAGDPAIFVSQCPKCPWRRDNVTRSAAALKSQHLATHEGEIVADAHAALDSLHKELQDLRWEREKYAALLVDLVHMHEDSQDALRDLNARSEDVHSTTYASALGWHNALQAVVNRSKKKTYPATY